MSIRKMSYDKIIDRYNDLQIKYNKSSDENIKLLRIIKKYDKEILKLKKEILDLKKENIELSVLLDAKIKKSH